MKKIIFITLSLVFYVTWVSAQSCLPDGIQFTSQSQIDSFQILHPNCSEIEGTVTIEGDDISSLGSLSVLTSVEGSLWIHNNIALSSLAGLDNLSYIGGSLSFIGNSALASLAGLENLTSTGDFIYMANNDALVSLAGLDNVSDIGGDISIVSNNLLSNLNELGSVTSIMGRIFIGGNMSLKSLTGLENVISIPGELRIVENDSLSSLSGLENLSNIGESIIIWNNDALTNLIALESITSIGGWLSIAENDVLNSLAGLDNIESSSIEVLVIAENFVLSTCEVLSVCEYLAIPGDSVVIYDNAPGCNSADEVEDSCYWVSIDDHYVTNNLLLFPNPAYQELNISVEGHRIQKASIFTLTGQQVFTIRPVTGRIDISFLRPGIYVLEVMVENRKIREKLMVQ